jgi:hypothetical protein
MMMMREGKKTNDEGKVSATNVARDFARAKVTTKSKRVATSIRTADPEYPMPFSSNRRPTHGERIGPRTLLRRTRKAEKALKYRS